MTATLLIIALSWAAFTAITCALLPMAAALRFPDHDRLVEG